MNTRARDVLVRSDWDHTPIQTGDIACANCRFWLAPKTTLALNGECRRHSPRPTNSLDSMMAEAVATIAWHTHQKTLTDDEPNTVKTESTEAYRIALWPRTDNYDWCGEFESRHISFAYGRPPNEG